MIRTSSWNESLRPSFRLAAGVGLLLLVAGGAGRQWLAAHYARNSESVPILPGTLTRLPLEIGEWRGRDVAMSDRIIRATDTDDHVNRTYTHAGRQRVGLWIGYGIRARDLMPHRPEVCYPGAGWTLEDGRDVELRTAGGSVVPCRLLRFSRGALRNERITVLTYYLVDGLYSPDVSAVRRRSWRFKSDLQYVAQVQITCSDLSFQGSAEESVTGFATQSADLIRDLLARAVAETMGTTAVSGHRSFRGQVQQQSRLAP